MTRLILMRHAKSSWADPGQEDIDRPLNARGLRDAPKIGAWLRARGHVPERALVSVARRTRETWEGVRTALGDVEARFEEDLYHAGPELMMKHLRAEAPGWVMMVGHQPGIAEMAARLVREMPVDPDYEAWPTGAVAVIEFPGTAWADVAWKSGRLVDFTVPRRL